MAISRKTAISPGSVTTCYRCGGIINNNFTANSQVSLSVREFWKLVKIWQSYWNSLVSSFFGTHRSSCSSSNSSLV